MIARAPLGFAIFLGCVAISTLFELLRFPERASWMLGFVAFSVAVVAVTWAYLRRRPQQAVPVLVAVVNVIGIALNVYHVSVGASVAMCIWTITGLLATSALLLPWGSRCQAIASAGAIAFYPVHLEAGVVDPLTWAAGAAYLMILVSLSVFAASLFAGYVRSDLQLSAALSEREARLQSYFDLSLVGTAIVLPDGTFIEVNEELCGMSGYHRGEMLGMSWAALVHPDEQATAATLFARALAGEPPGRRDLRCARKDGAVIHTIVSVRGLPGPDGAVDHVMVLLEDITDRKRAEVARERSVVRADAARRQAEEASRAKDAFLATVSHELRTPLTPILAWSSVLRQGGVDHETTAAALGAIERSVKTQTRLIEDLLDVSRIVSGEWRLALRPVDVAFVIRVAADLARPAAEMKGVKLGTTLPVRPVAVQGDPDRLQQVVSNLLSNAIKFTPPGGRVDVVLERVGLSARITVRDTGEGIPPDFLPHVFERFRQADSTSTRRHGGLGLGLAIVRALVELHDGTVHAASRGEGLGAVFTVDLPLTGEAGATAGPAVRVSHVMPSTALGGVHVLVVDDEPETTTAVGAALASCGADVRTAVSTPEALELAHRWPPDVLVSDIAMPGEDGYALLRKLREHGGALGQVPVIALTAYSSADDRTRLLAAGFREHIAKPADLAELAAAVGKAAGEIRRRP